MEMKRFQFFAGDDGVEETVVEQKFGALKTFGEFLADGLLDDAGAGETDERAGFGDVEIAEHGETGGDAAGGGVGEQPKCRGALRRRVAPSAAETLASCMRLMVPSIMRAPPEQETTMSGWRVAMESSTPRVTFSPTTAPMEPPMKPNSIAQMTTGATGELPSAVMTASFMPSFLRASLRRVGVGLGVDELQRVGGSHAGVVLGLAAVEKQFRGAAGVHFEVEAALGADVAGWLRDLCGKRWCRRTRT